MFACASKLSAPIAGVMLLVSAGMMSSASAAPLAGKIQVQSPQSELVVQVDHRRGQGRKRGQHWQDGRGWGQYELGPRQIRRSLRHRGFHRIKIVDRRGPMYIIKARAWGGQKMRLVVDSRNAHIVRSRPIGHRGYGNWQRRWY